MEGKNNIELCKHCRKHPDVIKCTGKKKVLFVFNIANTLFWKDGLQMALTLLENDFDITYWNMALLPVFPVSLEHFDFILGWSSFDGEIAHLMRNLKQPHGLCIGGYTFEPHNINHFNVLFYETSWYYEAELKHRHPNCVHAFGVNTDIFKPQYPKTFEPLQENQKISNLGIVTNGVNTPDFKLWDYITIGAFSNWKRQLKLLEKPGNRMAIGQIQENNMDESFDIISQLLAYGVAVQGEVSPEILAQYINAAKVVYLPADITGGSERSVLETRACGVDVEVEDDNAKLKELLTSPIWDYKYYASQLRKGIESCLK